MTPRSEANTTNVLPTVPTVAAKKPYRCIVLPGAPFYGATVGGIQFHDFSRRTEETTDEATGKVHSRSFDERGLIVHLTDEQAEKVRSDMAVTYVRHLNRKARLAQVFKPHGKEGPEDKREPVLMDPSTDEPCSKYLSFEPA